MRARETAEQERVDTLNAWVMSPAVPPIDRSFPPSNTVIFGAALLIGTLGGIALGLLRERLDPKLRTRYRVEALTGVPVLASIDASRQWQAPPASRRSETGPYGAPVDLPRCDPRSEDKMLGLLQALSVGHSSSTGRVLLLLGDRGENDVALVAQWLAAAAVADGRKATLVRFGEIDPAHDEGRGSSSYRAANAVAAAADYRNADAAASASVLDFYDISQPRQVPALLERLRGCIAGLAKNGVVVIASRRDAIAVPQLAELADSTLLVLTRSLTNRAEALAMVQRLTAKVSSLRGSVLVRRAA